jgi:hypothetical protein
LQAQFFEFRAVEPLGFRVLLECPDQIYIAVVGTVVVGTVVVGTVVVGTVVGGTVVVVVHLVVAVVLNLVVLARVVVVVVAVVALHHSVVVVVVVALLPVVFALRAMLRMVEGSMKDSSAPNNLVVGIVVEVMVVVVGTVAEVMAVDLGIDFQKIQPSPVPSILESMVET